MPNLMELEVSVTVDSKDAEKGIKEITNSTEKAGKSADKGVSKFTKLGNGIKTAMKVGAAATALLNTGIAVLGKKAIEAYADFEQLEGGVKKLFGEEASKQVMQYANEAYKTAGMSANTYMETVTSFSASLISSLGNDTAKAAEVANIAIGDMADNVNTFGSDMESVQNAYQGFAKQNYTMLDNLKLGYGGTKQEMERLIEDANKLKATQGEAANLTIDSYADVIEAIHTVQGEMNITGTTAKEASGTITGSIETMKAAWENLLAGMADPNADIKGLMDNLVESIGNVATNLAPAIGNFISAFSELASEGIHAFNDYMNSSEGQAAASNAVNNIAAWIGENTGPMLEAGATLAKVLLQGLFEGLIRVGQNNAAEYLEETGAWTAEEVQNAMDEAWDAWHEGKGLKAAMAAYKKSLEDSAHEGGTAFVDTTRSKIDDAIAAGKALADGTVDGSDSTDGMSENGTAAAEAYVNSVSGSYDDSESAGELIANGAEVGMKSQHNNASTWGKDLVSNFAAGMRSNFGIVGAAASGLAALIKSYIHFTEPDLGPLSDFHTYAPDMVELFAQGIKANKDKAKDAAWELADAVSEVLGNALNTSGIMKSMYGGLYDIWSKSYDIDNTEIRAAEDTLNSLQSMLKAQQGIVSEAEAARQQAIKAQEDVVEATRKAYDANVWNDSNLQAWEDAKALLEALKGSASADNTAKYGNNELYKTLIALQQENDLYDAINQKISEQKDAISALSESDDITKAKVQLQSLSKQYEKQNKSVAAANEAYAEILKQYGEGSEEAVEYRNKLIDEKSALQDITQQYNDLTDQINRYNDAMKTAASFAGSDYTSRLNFANSGLGTSTAALINATTTTEQNINLQADIVMDSTKVGEALYKPIINVFKNNGTTLSFAY